MAVKNDTATGRRGAAVTASAKAGSAGLVPEPPAPARPALVVRAATASKAGTPKASPLPRKVAPRKAPPIKLTGKELDLLRLVQQTKADGYLADKKADAKTLDALAGKKLIKRGAKDKASGRVRYLVSKAGAEQVASGAATA